MLEMGCLAVSAGRTILGVPQSTATCVADGSAKMANKVVDEMNGHRFRMKLVWAVVS